jgi:hypothetical protein
MRDILFSTGFTLPAHDLYSSCLASLQKGGTPSRQERKEQQMKGESFASLRAILGFFSGLLLGKVGDA